MPQKDQVATVRSLSVAMSFRHLGAGHETRRVLGLTYQGQAVLLVLTQTSPDVGRFLTAFSHKLVVACGGPDGGMILLCIRSSDGKRGSFDVKGQPYAS